jgi:endonuclease G
MHRLTALKQKVYGVPSNRQVLSHLVKEGDTPMFWIAFLIALLAFPALAQEADSSLPGRAETNFLRRLEDFELARTDLGDSLQGVRWVLRSSHFVFGMPRLIQDRHDFTPEGFTQRQTGITVVVREGFVVAHFDRMKSPLWVAQRWSRFDHTRMNQVPSQDRPWREDLEVPRYARGGTSYDGNRTRLDRGHMARHATNRAWGIDTSNWGTKVSNSAPQHRRINRFNSAWRELEDEIRDIVVRSDSGIEAVWTISGTIYRDRQNPDTETPEEDFQNVVRLERGGFGVPDATYKIVGWFDENDRFQARGYVFEQPHSAQQVAGEQTLTFTLGDTRAPLVEYLVRIDEIEQRTGVDFFPMLQDTIEDLIEAVQPQDVWGAQ